MKKISLIFLVSLFFFKISLSQINCPIDTVTISRYNLGLFGGKFLDLQFNTVNNRLFAGLETPASLFYTDDIGHTWHKAFQYDSLLYNCDNSGWGGAAYKVLTNSKGWVASLTRYTTLSSSQISFSNGDSGTFKTAMDNATLSSYGFTNVGSVTNFTLTDYAMFVLMESYIVKIDAATFNSLTDVTDISTKITGIGNNLHILSIAAANQSTNYPYYIAIDTNYNADNLADVLYKYDGLSFSNVSYPTTISNTVTEIFTLPQQITGDTLFITGYEKGTNNPKIYRSYDGGTSWTDVSCPFNAPLKKIIYSSAWPTAAHSILLAEGISTDLGNSWKKTSNSFYNLFPLAVHPTDTSIIATSFIRGLLVDSLGITNGNPHLAKNNYLEAIQINKIARSKNETVFYIATDAGLAYTTAYLNDNVAPIDKWKQPYGLFPADSTVLNSVATPFTAVDVNPNDSLHVIAGCNDGFLVSQNGYNAFQFVQPYYFNQYTSTVNDIKIISSNHAIAVTDAFIWKTSDGGLSWDSIIPSSYKNGNAIAISYNSIDTAIYIVTGNASPDSGIIWKSIDFGSNWQMINTGPKIFSTFHSPMQDMVVKNNTDTLFIFAGNRSKSNTNQQSSLVMSPDGGLTYATVFDFNQTAYSLAINTQYHDSLYVGAGRKIYVYDYKNDSLFRVFNGLPNEPILDIAYGSVFAGTTSGFYSIDLQPFEDIPLAINEIIYLSDHISIYPNPSQNVTYIKVSPPLPSSICITLYNVIGEEVVKQNITVQNQNELVIPILTTNFKSGIYFCTIELNNTFYFSKLIIQR